MLQATATHTAHAPPATACGDVADFKRLCFFHGRALSALDLRREQSYHLEKHRFHNRTLHGWGIVCGLDIELVRYDTSPPSKGQRTTFVVTPGSALDCAGNEIVVRNPREVDLDDLLSDVELTRLRRRAGTVYLTLCYHEQPIDPTRPLLAAGCEPVASCQYGRVCETFSICASTTRPDPGPACEPCCGGCGDVCIELAAIERYSPKGPIEPSQVNLHGRRALAVHELAEIGAINWTHGATYSRADATALLEQGLRVEFTRRVRVASLRPHVVELTVIESGGGRSAGIYNVETQFVGLTGEFTDHVVVRSVTDESLQPSDRVQVRIHGDFILDECCRAIDANHIGGNVPLTAQDVHAQPLKQADGPPCPPRQTGNGTEGGEFVSWFLVAPKGRTK